MYSSFATEIKVSSNHVHFIFYTFWNCYFFGYKENYFLQGTKSLILLVISVSVPSLLFAYAFYIWTYTSLGYIRCLHLCFLGAYLFLVLLRFVSDTLNNDSTINSAVWIPLWTRVGSTDLNANDRGLVRTTRLEIAGWALTSYSTCSKFTTEGVS